MYCKKCGTENRKIAKFCKNCGIGFESYEYSIEKTDKDEVEAKKNEQLNQIEPISTENNFSPVSANKKSNVGENEKKETKSKGILIFSTLLICTIISLLLFALDNGTNKHEVPDNNAFYNEVYSSEDEADDDFYSSSDEVETEVISLSQNDINLGKNEYIDITVKVDQDFFYEDWNLNIESDEAKYNGKVLPPEGINIRDGAGTKYDIVGTAARKSKVNILGQETDEYGYTWYYIETKYGDIGYTRPDLLEVKSTFPIEYEILDTYGFERRIRIESSDNTGEAELVLTAFDESSSETTTLKVKVY